MHFCKLSLEIYDEDSSRIHLQSIAKAQNELGSWSSIDSKISISLSYYCATFEFMLMNSCIFLITLDISGDFKLDSSINFTLSINFRYS